MCAVCFTGFQIVPVAAVAARLWYVSHTRGPEDVDDDAEPLQLVDAGDHEARA